jgi:hypothetical protein
MECGVQDQWHPCENCHRVFPNVDCHTFHKKPSPVRLLGTKHENKKVKEGGISPCEQFIKCECGKVVDRTHIANKRHACFAKYCNV